MERFGYVRANSLHEAVSLLNESDILSRPLAGGTDLILLSRLEHICDRIVDISFIPEMHQIARQGDVVTIGAGTVFSDIIENAVIQETAPLLVQACRQIGAVQVRNMGTIGGNVANAAACADTLPTLVCLDARAKVVTPGCEYDWSVSEMVVGPNRTQIPKGGLLCSLTYQVPQPGSRSVFLKLGRRNAMAISRLTVAALGRLDEHGRVIDVRLVPGSATPHIQRFSQVESYLLGKTPDGELCMEAGRLAIEEMIEITGRRWSSEFKEPVLQALVTRSLINVFGLGDEALGRQA
ncbi:MAG: FAD binding domain-containing protein [Anaerolineaceae bacterium]|nr:FAD binding domain-containing protein [Anaerolineaceae bacterium]